MSHRSAISRASASAESWWIRLNKKIIRFWMTTRVESLVDRYRNMSHACVLGTSYEVWTTITKSPQDCPCEYASFWRTTRITKRGVEIFSTNSGFARYVSDEGVRDLLDALKKDKF